MLKIWNSIKMVLILIFYFKRIDGLSASDGEGQAISKRQLSVLMDPSVKNYQKLVKSAKEFMRGEIEKVSKYEQNRFRHDWLKYIHEKVFYVNHYYATKRCIYLTFNNQQLPLSKYADCLHPGEIDPVLLLFRDKTWERPYLMEHDPLFKFYILATFVILIASGGILFLTEGIPNYYVQS